MVPMITLSSKSDKTLLRGILHATDPNVVSDNIFNSRERDVSISQIVIDI